MIQYMRVSPNGNMDFANVLSGFIPKNTTISEKGKVKFFGKIDTISYNMEKFTEAEALVDFTNTRMVELYKREGFRIYKMQKL